PPPQSAALADAFTRYGRKAAVITRGGKMAGNVTIWDLPTQPAKSAIPGWTGSPSRRCVRGCRQGLSGCKHPRYVNSVPGS
ncbi:hypothetical protein, partial [Klebsiella oxytoca]|uniref:hypothetical protein n=1 Tax=Klebsiella oxytoca TaxID=571 RepID=UPI00195542FC